MCTQPAQPLKVITCSTAETRALGRALGELLPPGSIVALVGDLGAGKTCLTAGLALGLGIAEPISSPTFNLVLEYDEPNARLPLYHFDTYRLTDRAEFEQLGLAEYFDRGGICVIEWAERIAALLPEHTLFLRFERRVRPEEQSLHKTADGVIELAADDIPRLIRFDGNEAGRRFARSAVQRAGLIREVEG